MGRSAEPSDDPPRGIVELADLRRSGVARLMAQYDFARGHAEQVRRLADRLAEQLAAPLMLGEESRLILSTAALLHDIGWHFGRAKHHRRSYELIKSNGLSGFSPEQVELIALVARYHRKAHPKLRHQPYAKLGPLQRRTVEALAGVLRVADGLDRTHRSVVEDVLVDTNARRVRLTVVPRFGDLDAELAAASKKSKLLESVLNRRVRITPGRHQIEAGTEPC